MTHIWLRAESKPREQRTALTPQYAQQLIDAGFQVTVEEAPQCPIATQDYAAAGCTIAPTHSWQTAAPPDAFILGLKELAASDAPLHHRHIHFAHVYKEQLGWQKQLNRFVRGGGSLYDLEFLVDEQGRRVAAFGHWAGFAGAALAVLAWSGQQSGDHPILAAVESRPSKDALIAELQQALQRVSRPPQVMVIGALGRSGRGVICLCQSVGIEPLQWDLEETKAGGPFSEVLQHDILLNCVFVQQPISPFVTTELLQSPRRLSLICDVSCDPYGAYNPLPIYEKCTSFDEPTLRITNTPSQLDLIAIDHLPSLLPIESSEDFCAQLMPFLLQLDRPQEGVWQRAWDVFAEKSALTQLET